MGGGDRAIPPTRRHGPGAGEPGADSDPRSLSHVIARRLNPHPLPLPPPSPAHGDAYSTHAWLHALHGSTKPRTPCTPPPPCLGPWSKTPASPGGTLRPDGSTVPQSIGRLGRHKATQILVDMMRMMQMNTNVAKGAIQPCSSASLITERRSERRRGTRRNPSCNIVYR